MAVAWSDQTSHAKVKSQVEKFREAARELETDDDESRFDERLGVIAKPPRQPKAKDKPDD